MKSKECKNKKCKRTLPDNYKNRYCENCRNEQVNQVKSAGKAALGLIVLVGSTAIAVATKGKFNPKK